MGHLKNKVVFGTTLIGFIMGLIGLIGIVFGWAAKPAKWDRAAEDVDKLTELYVGHDKLIAVQGQKLDNITEIVKDIRREVRRR